MVTNSSKSSSTRKKSRFAEDKHPNHRDSRTHEEDDIDDQTISTFTTLNSTLQSLLERRRRWSKHYSALTVHEHESDYDYEESNGHRHHNHNHSSSRRSTGDRSSRHSSTQSSRRQKYKRKSSRHNKHPLGGIQPIILLVFIGFASNYFATRILKDMFILDDDDGRASNGRDAIHKSLREYDSENPNNYVHNNMQYEEHRHQIMPGFQRNQEFRYDREEEGNYADEQQQLGLLDQSRERFIDIRSVETDTIQSAQLTKRFTNLRQRLLSLYSETVPADEVLLQNTTTISKTTTVHPLYNDKTPQYKALYWLANIDKVRLRHYDPGLIQRYVLAVMYFSTGGPMVDEDTDLSQKRKGPWRNPTNFLAPTHECEWKSRIIDGAGRGGGIRRCDKNRTVVEISLYNELTGTVPTELGRLWNLRTLYLGRNQLTGTIPTELGMIQKLSSLSLQYNDLSGEIPESHLKNLNSLRAFQVEGNERLRGNLRKHSLLCQMRNKYRGPTPKNQEKYTGRRVLRILTATCVPPSYFGNSAGASDRLECACCTECFGKTPKDLIYH